MSNSFCPLVRKIKAGSFVTFQSTGDDITYTFNNSNRKFKFSKFALLNLPPIVTPTNNNNTIQFKAIEGVYSKGLSTATPPPEGDKVDFSESLQNYLLNLETLLIRNSNYDPTQLQNASERIFCKWLKEINALRFRAASATEKSSTIVDPRFVEEDDNSVPSSGDLYNRVIKYIGEIDIDGTNRSSTNAFKEIYVYIPTQNGHTPTVLFKSVADVNYYAGQTIRKEDNLDIEFIQGRTIADQPTTAGLDVEAFYDMDVALGTYNYVVNGSSSNPIWFDTLAPNGPNAYFTDPAFNVVLNDLINRSSTTPLDNITYKRSRLDGIMIDWDKPNYYAFEQDATLSAFNQYNASTNANSFQFNTILLYYDIFDPNNPSNVATNLYGVMFLNDLEVVSTGGSRLRPFDKIKPNPIVREQGNGYGFKINLKFDTTADNVTSEVEVSVNDYNTFSMQLFSDTMQRMAQANDNFETVLEQNLELLTKITELETLILTDSNKLEVMARIDEINALLVGVTPNQDLLDMIAANKAAIDAILAGSTTVNLSFALDLRPSDGLRLELIGNKLFFKNTQQEYTLSNEININTSPNQQTAVYNVLKLDTHTTLHYHKNNGVKKTAQGNISLFIDDSVNEWKLNQVMRVAIIDEIDFLNFGIAIYTDATNQFGLSGNYQKLVGIVPSIAVGNTKPIIEIVCVDQENYEFIIMVK